MSDTDRLYALSSTYTHPWLDADGPGLLINDPVLAMRWYLTHEREQYLAVTGHVSHDAGATWQPLAPHQLLADAEQHLGSAAQTATGATQLLHRALQAEAAEWIDARIRFFQPDGPRPWLPETPELSSWQRGGQIWALALGTVPDTAVMAHLASLYTDPQPEGPGLMQAAARDTLTALALADDPQGAQLGELIRAWRLLERLTFGSEAGQVDGRARAAQQTLMGHLISHHPDTAPVIVAYADPAHPAHQAARFYLRPLAQIGAGEESLLADARAAFDDALQEADAIPAPAPATAATPTDPEQQPPAIPGYPKPLLDDLQAAAAWRLRSPAARRAAERIMEDLTHATGRLAEVTAHRDLAQPPTSDERAAQDHAASWRNYYQDRLAELDAQHAMLMHASILADAEEAATPATHELIIAASQATERSAQPGEHPRQTHQAFMAEVEAGERRIADVLAEQRQLTRDALHNLFPKLTGRQGLHTLRTQLIEHSGLGIDAYTRAYDAIGQAGRRLRELEANHQSGYVEFGRQPVTGEQVEQARADVENAEQRFADLRASRPPTLRAVKVLDGVAGMEPSASGSLAARAARIKTPSRERAVQPPAAATEPLRADDTQHTHHLQQPGTGQIAHLP
ncbi:hypothetical protein [Streptomyces sp. 7N604]|uniref:hypothetical protein n=1 Tax=Streptomyces sp. 7N604 TaxID=3457415 RepID=UPI003FD06723